MSIQPSPLACGQRQKFSNAVAGALEWSVRHRGAGEIDHYLDDFIIVGPPQSRGCASSLRILGETCQQLGVPIAAEKCQGPSTCLVFLGIEMDILAM